MVNRREHRIPDRVRNAILMDPCAYCGDAWPTTIDHIIPVSKGGTSERSNLAPACRPCNMEKLDFTPDEWRGWREERGWPWPPISRLAFIRQLVDEQLKMDPEFAERIERAYAAGSVGAGEDGTVTP